jgi:hypothetical protein
MATPPVGHLRGPELVIWLKKARVIILQQKAAAPQYSIWKFESIGKSMFEGNVRFQTIQSSVRFTFFGFLTSLRTSLILEMLHIEYRAINGVD